MVRKLVVFELVLLQLLVLYDLMVIMMGLVGDGLHEGMIFGNEIEQGGEGGNGIIRRSL